MSLSLKGIGDSKIGYIGSCIAQGQKLDGVNLASPYLRSQKIITKLGHKCSHVFDFGDIQDYSLKAYRELSKNCQKSAELFDLTLITGGDHSQAIGSIHGLKRAMPKLKIIWIDAHGDINTPQTSLSGNLHGMPLAALLGLFNYATNESWFHPVLRPNDVALLGVRDLDPGEIITLQKQNIFVMSTQQVQEVGVDLAVKMALQSIDPMSESPLHISFDLDCLSEEYITATGIRVRDGFSPEMAMNLVKNFASTNRVKSMEVVEFNPLLASSEEELQFYTNYICDLYLNLIRSLNVSLNVNFNLDVI